MWNRVETAIILLSDLDSFVEELPFQVIAGTWPAQLFASLATRQSLVTLSWLVRSGLRVHDREFTFTRRCLQELQARSAQPDASTFPVLSMQKWVMRQAIRGHASLSDVVLLGVVVRKCP